MASNSEEPCIQSVKDEDEFRKFAKQHKKTLILLLDDIHADQNGKAKSSFKCVVRELNASIYGYAEIVGNEENLKWLATYGKLGPLTPMVLLYSKLDNKLISCEGGFRPRDIFEIVSRMVEWEQEQVAKHLQEMPELLKNVDIPNPKKKKKSTKGGDNK